MVEGTKVEHAGLSIERYATICAHIAEGQRTIGAVLQDHGLTREAWLSAQVQWNRALMANESLGDAYSAAFAAAQDAIKPVPSLTVEQWAELTAALAHGGDALGARGLTAADHLRLARHWARRLGASKTEASSYFAALHAAQARAR